MQQLDYCAFIELYGERISGFHVKDAEFRPTIASASTAVTSRGTARRTLPLARRRPIHFKRVFSLMTDIGFDGWAVLEWECCVKSPEQGAREGAPFIRQHPSNRPLSRSTISPGTGSGAEANREMFQVSPEEGTMESWKRKLRMGMVGGGQGALHRRRRSHRRNAGPAGRARRRLFFAVVREYKSHRRRSYISISPRCYPAYEAMARQKQNVRPTNESISGQHRHSEMPRHFAIAKHFLNTAFHVVCDQDQ